MRTVGIHRPLSLHPAVTSKQFQFIITEVPGIVCSNVKPTLQMWKRKIQVEISLSIGTADAKLYADKLFLYSSPDKGDLPAGK